MIDRELRPERVAVAPRQLEDAPRAGARRRLLDLRPAVRECLEPPGVLCESLALEQRLREAMPEEE